MIHNRLLPYKYDTNPIENNAILLLFFRFDNIKSSPQAAAEVADRWKHATHPNIIQLHGAWVHQRALFFTHDYHPGAQT